MFFFIGYGGYSSLFFASLSRRQSSERNLAEHVVSEGSTRFDNSYLPPWCPELRQNVQNWEAIFTNDYAASTPMHHMASFLHYDTGPRPMLIRGHRIDVVFLGFHISRSIEPCQKLNDFIYFRYIMKFFPSLKFGCEYYPTREAWIAALGSALMTAMPSEPNEDEHPFQRYLNQYGQHTRLNDQELKRIWQLYLRKILMDRGEIWTKVQSVFRAQVTAQARKEKGRGFNFNPFKMLTNDGQKAWLLQKYLSDVLQRHRFVISARKYTIPGDIITMLGGPGTGFVLRDLTVTIYSELEAKYCDRTSEATNGFHATVVPSTVSIPMSQLRGPCHIRGLMNGELYQEERYKTTLEWETDQFDTIPRPTICLV